MTISFYRTDAVPYGCFTNFSTHGFELDGCWWPTSEHFYQAQKFVGTPYADLIREAPTARRAADLGRDPSRTHRPDWPQVRDEVMHRAVLAKFTTHADIREILLGTGHELLIEDSPTDYYWGLGEDGTGQNMLGQILMRVRTELRTTNL